MKEKPKVLTLYAPTLAPAMDMPIEMRVTVFPYNPQAHFLVHALSEYHEHWNNRWRSTYPERNGYTLCTKDRNISPLKKPVARLERETLVAKVTKLELARMLFGFHPSKEIALKLQELALDDERTEQILNQLKYLDNQFSYAYLGTTIESKHHVIATKKEQRDNLIESLPRNAFWKYKGFAHPESLCFPRFNSFTGSLKEGQLKTAYPLCKINNGRGNPLTRAQVVDPIQKKLFGIENPFLIFYGNSSYEVPRNYTSPLPPEDLNMINHFPHKDADWKEFLERKGEFPKSDDLLIRALSRKNQNP